MMVIPSWSRSYQWGEDDGIQDRKTLPAVPTEVRYSSGETPYRKPERNKI